jgi:hypothetical protein
MKKLLALALATLVMNLGFVNSVHAKPSAEREMQFAAKVKAAILKLGSGPAAHVEIKMRDGTKLKGYVSEANDSGFVVVDQKDGASRDVLYPQVKQVKGNNLSTGAKIAIGVGVAVGILVLILVVIGPRVMGS